MTIALMFLLLLIFLISNVIWYNNGYKSGYEDAKKENEKFFNDNEL